MQTVNDSPTITIQTIDPHRIRGAMIQYPNSRPYPLPQYMVIYESVDGTGEDCIEVTANEYATLTGIFPADYSDGDYYAFKPLQPDQVAAWLMSDAFPAWHERRDEIDDIADDMRGTVRIAREWKTRTKFDGLPDVGELPF